MNDATDESDELGYEMERVRSGEILLLKPFLIPLTLSELHLWVWSVGGVKDIQLYMVHYRTHALIYPQEFSVLNKEVRLVTKCAEI